MEKAFDKTQHALMINVLENVGLEEHISTIYEKPTVNIILNGGEK